MRREFQSNIFDDVRNKLVSAHCTVTSNVLTVIDENYKLCIFLILPVNVPRSYYKAYKGRDCLAAETIEEKIKGSIVISKRLVQGPYNLDELLFDLSFTFTLYIPHKKPRGR